VEYLGHVDDMPALMARADIVVLPSYREGTPRVLVEAAAAGKPIVATDIGGCRGLVEDGVNGLLVPVRDADALAVALRRLAQDAGLRERFGRAGRAIFAAGFSEELVLGKTLAVYGELLRGCDS
jgi:glycosyltransferase involved in cell wall biosynthesis